MPTLWYKKKAEITCSRPVWDEDTLLLGTCNTPDSQSILRFASYSVNCPRCPFSTGLLLWPSVKG